MKKSIYFLTATTCLSILPKEGVAKDNPPNIILIMTDDQGIGDVGYMGNPYVKTPVLDQLASKSVQFDRFYVSPVSAPTRASLLTGKFYQRTGVRDTYNGGAIMDTKEITLAEILSKSGYKTAIYGKWHLGDNYPYRPMEQGFHESLIHHSGGIGQVGDIYNFYRKDSSYFSPTLIHNGKKTKTQGYCSDVFTDGAIRFVEQYKQQPFFLYLSFNAPHTPLQLPQKYYDMYKDMSYTSNDDAFGGKPVPEMSARHMEEARKIYGMVTNIDDNIGRLVKTLKKSGVYDNTILIFLTDNGPQQLRYTAGFKGRKGMVSEGGIRVPCFIHYPREFRRKQVVSEPAAHIDLLPTIATLTNLPASSLPSDIDGKNLLPTIKAETQELSQRPLFFHWNRGYPEKYYNQAVILGKYKLVGNTSHSSPIEDFSFYDLEKDPYEQQNIIAQNTDKAAEMKTLLDNHFDKVLHERDGQQPLPIMIGTSHENPVLLNRNDAAGPPAIWAQQEGYGYWVTQVEKSGYYNVRAHFHQPVGQRGSLVFKAPPFQYKALNSDTHAQDIYLKKVYIEKGTYQMEAMYNNRLFPFFMEIEGPIK